MTEYYNVRLKSFPDGVKQYLWSERTQTRGTEKQKKKRDGHSVKQKEIENHARAIQKVYDYAKSNDFEWFITLTFDKDKVNRYDYDSVSAALSAWTKALNNNSNCGKFAWLIVPEQHDDGAYHFHGLIKGDLPVTQAINPRTNEPLKDKAGNQVYNITTYKHGFTTATKIKDRKRTASYITKYLTKEIVVPKGKKRYWASRNLNKPTEKLLTMSTYEFGELAESARYSKTINSPFGAFFLIET